MTREERKTLLIDLCMRLPYHPKIKIYNDSWEGCQKGEFDSNLYFHHAEAFLCDRIEILPYLRPMSSMTDEEKLDYIALGDIKRYTNPQYAYLISEQLDYLNAHHFDYRGLIPMGLALESKEEMYN